MKATLLLAAVATGVVTTGHRSARRIEDGAVAAVTLRAGLLADPAAAWRAHCRAEGADGARVCRPRLFLRGVDGWQVACPPRDAHRARYYRIVLACQIWPGQTSRRLLDVVIFR